MRRSFLSLLVLACLAGAALLLLRRRAAAPSEGFVQMVGRGNALFTAGNVPGAAAIYERALALAPESVDVRLNLANAWLRLGRDADAIAMAREALRLDRNNAAAYYLMGCADMHLSDWTAAVQAFQESQAINPRVTALNYQLGLAQEAAGQANAALNDFLTVTLFDPGHAQAHYQLSRIYRRLGRAAEAASEMQEHDRLVSRSGAPPSDPFSLEQCVYTQPRAPFVLAQPDRPGIPVRFVDETAEGFGTAAAALRGPIAVIDYAQDGRNSLVARERSGGFRLFDNHGGKFSAAGRTLPARASAEYRHALVGDLADDGAEEVVVLGPDDSRVYRFGKTGRGVEVTAIAHLRHLRARDGVLADLDFTGNLDLLTVAPDGRGLQVQRNLGNMAFDTAEDTGLPASLPGARSVDVEDWGNDGRPNVFVARDSGPPAAFVEPRASKFRAEDVSAGWPSGRIFAAGDFNNDLALDVVIDTGSDLRVLLSGSQGPLVLPLRGLEAAGLLLTDFDNDGWLDIVAYGPNGMRAWRNEGHAGFQDVTDALGLGGVGAVEGAVAADFSGSGATDLMLVTPRGVRLLRNVGGAANHQFKLRLDGRRSNASGLGVRVEVSAGRWRTSRTIHSLPIEIGTGRHARLDTLAIHWMDLATTNVDVPVTRTAFDVVEPKLPSGSCPYLYAWNGRRFRFVTDILGAAPLGLPLSASRLVPSDPRELIALGDERALVPRGGAYELRLTDELREILYLDEARLVVVDHPRGTFVASTSKLRPAPPFPAPAVWTLRPLRAPLRAIRSDGADETEALARADGRMASPVALRRPQLRGLAEPYSLTLDFGPLETRRPLVLALNGWLQFGGGMANVAAALDPAVGPPFPVLEVQTADGSWRKVAVEVGAPSGKTKTILVDLAGRLPEGSRRLRLSTGFEIHWDAALLCERAPSAPSLGLAADTADLHWRGFSAYLPQRPDQPLTPDYGRVVGVPPWDFTPAGWCTRYGDVRELISATDDKLAILNGGDELTLRFAAGRLPPKAPGMVRDFFLYVDGWDKDADFHVRAGDRVTPLPFQGMDDQAYGAQPRPASLDAGWTDAYNTRWVGPTVLARQPAVSP